MVLCLEPRKEVIVTTAKPGEPDTDVEACHYQAAPETEL